MNGPIAAATGTCTTGYHSDILTYDGLPYTFAEEGIFKLMDNIYDNVFIQVETFLDGSSSPHCAVAVRSVNVRPGETLILDMCDATFITAYKCQLNQTYPIYRTGAYYSIEVYNGAILTVKENGHCIILDLGHPAGVFEGSTWGLCGNFDGNPGNDFEVLPGDGNTNMEIFLEAARLDSGDPNFFEECLYLPALVVDV